MPADGWQHIRALSKGTYGQVDLCRRGLERPWAVKHSFCLTEHATDEWSEGGSAPLQTPKGDSVPLLTRGDSVPLSTPSSDEDSSPSDEEDDSSPLLSTSSSPVKGVERGAKPPCTLALDALTEHCILSHVTPHPYIVQFKGSLTSTVIHTPSSPTSSPSGYPCLVMDYVPSTLHDAIHKKDFFRFTSPEQRRSLCRTLLRQLCSALAHVHARHVVHGDVKPENLLLTSKWTLQLADFGLASFRAADVQEMSSSIQSRAYRAPELLMGAEVFTSAVDMWAFGALWCEWIVSWSSLLYEDPSHRSTYPFQLTPWNRGRSHHARSDTEQMLAIFYHLGTPTEASWPGCSILPYFSSQWPQFKPGRMTTTSPLFQYASQTGVATEDDLRALMACFRYNPSSRPTAAQLYVYFGGTCGVGKSPHVPKPGAHRRWTVSPAFEARWHIQRSANTLIDRFKSNGGPGWMTCIAILIQACEALASPGLAVRQHSLMDPAFRPLLEEICYYIAMWIIQGAIIASEYPILSWREDFLDLIKWSLPLLRDPPLPYHAAPSPC